MVCPSRPYHFKFFKGCLPQSSLGPFLNTLSHIQMHSDNVVSMTTSLIPKTSNTKTNKSHVSIIKSYGSIQHIISVPTYYLSTETNVERIFLKLIKKHSPKGYSLNKIFIKNTVKVSYMDNSSSIILSHNRNILM